MRGNKRRGNEVRPKEKTEMKWDETTQDIVTVVLSMAFIAKPLHRS